MEADLQSHRCRICSRGFSNGRSLGGHMRSHVQASKLDSAKKEKPLQSSRKQAAFRAGYGLRENPRKTCRLSDFVEEDFESSSRYCRECGKGFPSWKAFFDHMIRFHSELTFNRSFGAEVQEDGFSDDDEALPAPAPAPAATRKRKLNRFSPIIEASSSTITDYESETEDVAISLMMLSRDTGGYWLAETAVAGEYSDKNSTDFEDDSGKWKMKRNLAGGNFQCGTCEKKFQSYHALGGHRASHKRIKTCCLAKTKEEDNVAHECGICGKAFSTGNALGGHRRSHFVSNGGGNGRRELVVVSEMRDLKLPAQVDGKSTLRFNP
ncbi:Zinc finger protein ZAT1 [Platanthera guangdongensis]|uniref:Zinc finger protein ZAT1 n=1 Tax=Platanthera guangdongensis TaxID=2320717 RepID=A0ABR2MCI9_9ASPA